MLGYKSSEDTERNLGNESAPVVTLETTKVHVPFAEAEAVW